MKTRESEQTFLNLFIDLILLNIAMPLAAWILSGEGVPDYRQVGIYFLHGNLAWMFTFLFFGRHNVYLTDSYSKRFIRQTRDILGFGVFAAAIALVVIPPTTYAKHLLVCYVLIFYTGKLLFSLLLYKYLFYKRKNDLNTKRVMIVGVNETGRLLKRIIESNPVMGYHFAGFVSRDEEPRLNTLGSARDLENLIEVYNIQKVFVTVSLFSNGEALQDYLEICNRRGVRLRFVPEDQHLYESRNPERCIGSLVMINPQELPIDRLSNRILKRVFDIVFSSLVMIFIFSWIYPILAILIRLGSRGPVFFRQKRTGINNKTFNCFKFRSMRCNILADEKQATAGDDRITPIGRFMRNYYIDEIPQFLNVLMGDMSVVGPRPHMLKHTEVYEKLIKDYQVRHFFKPGVTGWAQVSGLCGETEELWKMEKRIEYDIDYIENWTFGLDLKIIWLTVFGRKRSKVRSSEIRCVDIHKEANRRLYEPITSFTRKAIL